MALLNTACLPHGRRHDITCTYMPTYILHVAYMNAEQSTDGSDALDKGPSFGF